jgi:YVTN family beta-propeller protein
VRFRILGPLEARADGRELALGGPKPRALLAMLLLQANRPVARDRLIEGLWGEQVPVSAGHNLDDYVSRLRKALGANRIERQAPGYLLRVEPDELDLAQFEALLEQGRAVAAGDPASARDALGAALALWRGPALADLLYQPFASSESERLEERRLLALEERIDADIALGGGSELVAELERLVAEQPFRERLLGQLMLALYRSGRQAEALGAYQAARKRLAEELGLEPSPELQELERRVLAHDPALAAPRRLKRADGRSGLRPVLLVPVAIALGAAVVSVAAWVALGTWGTRASVREAAFSQVVEIGAGARPGGQSTTLEAAPAAMTTDGASLWLAEPDAGVVVRVDPGSHEVVQRIAVGGEPGALAASGGSIWVANVQSSKLTRIDPETETIVQRVGLGGATAAALASGRDELWVADPTDGALIELDPRSGVVRRTVQLDLRPTALAIGAGGLWVADYDANTVAEVDPQTGATIATVQVGNGPAALAIGGGAVWVANDLDSTVSRIDPASGSVVATIPVGSGPSSLAITPRWIWVGNEYSQTVTKIDPTRNVPVATAPVGGGPTALAVEQGGLWVGTRPLEEHRGGTLRLLSSQPLTLDPALDYVVPPLQFAGLTGDSLVTFEHTGGPNGQRLVPDLAVSLPTPSDDGTTYTFRLRPGIRYSDGRPLRASDFRRAFERLFRLHSEASGFFSGVVGASACLRPGSTACDLSRGIVVDDSAGTVTFRLTAPDPDFLFKLTIGGFSMPVPPGTPLRPLRFRPIPGTGPYRVASADARGIRLVRNPYFREWSYAAQPAGNPNTIVWHFGVPLAQEIRTIEEGRADWTLDQIPAPLLAAARVHYANQLHSSGPTETDFYQLNTTIPPFDELRVRQAFNLALNRNEIVRLYGGTSVASPTCQVLPPAIPGYRPYCPYTHAARLGGAYHGPDLARARRLVAASHTSGEPVTVWGWTDDATITPAVTRYTARVLARLGYRVRTRLIAHAAFDHLSAAVKRTIQLIPAGWVADYPSAYDFFSIWLSCSGAYDSGWFCDPRLDRQMRRADSLEVSNPALAAGLWSRIDRRAVNEAAWAPLANPRMIDFVSGRVRNYQHNPILGIVTDQLWLR